MTNTAFVRTATALRDRVGDNSFAAILLLLAICLGSGMAVLIRFLGEGYSVFQIVFIRSAIMLCVLIPFIMRLGMAAWKTSQPLLVLLRGATATMGQVLGVLAIIHLPLATVQALSFSRSFILVALGALILGEIVTWRRWVAVVVGFFGVMIVLQPGPTMNWAGLYALGSTGAFTISIICAKILLRTHSRSTLMTYNASMQAILMVVPAILVWQAPMGGDWLYFLGMGTLALCVQPLSLQAFKVGDVSALAPVEYFRLLTAAAVGFFIFAEVPSTTLWLGALVIIGANMQTMRLPGSAWLLRRVGFSTTADK
ncbi:MAG: DMT family transporter [Pseudomonadota bacterium]